MFTKTIFRFDESLNKRFQGLNGFNKHRSNCNSESDVKRSAMSEILGSHYSFSLCSHWWMHVLYMRNSKNFVKKTSGNNEVLSSQFCTSLWQSSCSYSSSQLSNSSKPKKMNKKPSTSFSAFLKSDSLVFIRFPFISNAVILLEEKIRVSLILLLNDIGWFCK